MLPRRLKRPRNKRDPPSPALPFPGASGRAPGKPVSLLTPRKVLTLLPRLTSSELGRKRRNSGRSGQPRRARSGKGGRGVKEAASRRALSQAPSASHPRLVPLDQRRFGRPFGAGWSARARLAKAPPTEGSAVLLVSLQQPQFRAERKEEEVALGPRNWSNRREEERGGNRAGRGMAKATRPASHFRNVGRAGRQLRRRFVWQAAGVAVGVWC